MKIAGFVVAVLVVAVLLSGCSAPQKGGSSLPWTEPQQWERNITPSMQF